MTEIRAASISVVVGIGIGIEIGSKSKSKSKRVSVRVKVRVIAKVVAAYRMPIGHNLRLKQLLASTNTHAHFD